MPEAIKDKSLDSVQKPFFVITKLGGSPHRIGDRLV
jgi:hypothetical protein